MKKFLPILLLCSFIGASFGQSSRHTFALEEVINDFMGVYPFSLDNRLKLSIYSELKGKYSNSQNMMTLNFGSLGTMFFFQENCLLKTHHNRAYSLDTFDENGDKIQTMNMSMQQMFEEVILLGNYGASEELLQFVDEGLMRKNIEPFHKIYLRHILLKYGRYEPSRDRVVFHSEWLPNKHYTYTDPAKGEIVNKHSSPLKIVMDRRSIRGYYVDIGGEVYVHDVGRNVIYASAEDFNYNNITAFKLFVQKFFIESIQYVVESEAKRVRELSQVSQVVMSSMGSDAPEVPVPESHSNRPVRLPRRATASYTTASPTASVKPLYHEYSWIPMMLTILRHNTINIGDPDVICYFVDQPYFSRLYDQLNIDERVAVDHYLSYR